MDDALALQKCTRLLRDLYLRVTQIILQARLDFDPSLCDATELRAVYGSLGSFNFRDRVELQCLRCLQRLSSMLGGGEQLLGGDAMNGFSIAIYKVPRAAQTVDGREPEASRELLERWSIQLLDPSERTTDDRGGGSSLSASSMHRKGDFASLYKKAIIFVRSLYSYTRMVPAHGLARYAKRKPAPRRPGGGGGAAAAVSLPPFRLDYEIVAGLPRKGTPRPTLQACHMGTPLGTVAVSLYFSSVRRCLDPCAHSAPCPAPGA
jgi:hypothetical protein